MGTRVRNVYCKQCKQLGAEMIFNNNLDKQNY